MARPKVKSQLVAGRQARVVKGGVGTRRVPLVQAIISRRVLSPPAALAAISTPD
jgi:hypothetical protein